ncbi:MAG: response regulator transcription factor [Saprospiraceae bacterium]|nr:response regulator transcription factor [Saprospiraceae bacterium]
MIRSIIVEDEPLAMEILEMYITKSPDINLVKKCTNAIEAYEALMTMDIDLMFLDIFMPGISGIELLRSLENPPIVIFTTASSDYAVEGFELNAADYLLKPISFERFSKACQKASDILRGHTNDDAAMAIPDVETSFNLNVDKQLVQINYSEVLYIKGLKDYVIIKKQNGQLVSLQTMKFLEEKLPSSIFKRVHKSYIVNMDKICAVSTRKVEINEAGRIKEIPIGALYKGNFMGMILENRF